MDILPLHIEYLLTRHDCVIVPGFGAFIATETEAYIDFETGIICPRRREISFNSNVVTDDGLLSHSIARREGMSYEDARRQLSILTERMVADLNEEGEVSVGMVGKLLKDAEGLISFQPRRSAVFSDILNEVRLSRLTGNVIEVTESASSEETFEEGDGMRTIRVKADRYVFTVSKRAVHAAAMLIAVLTVGVSLLLPVNHDNQQRASVISIEGFFHHTVKTDAFSKMKDTADANIEAKDSIMDIEPSGIDEKND